jgi:hypothetical protein
MKWRIDYSDEHGAGDLDPCDYDTLGSAQTAARAALGSNDMPWAVEARLFATDDDGEPAADQTGAMKIHKVTGAAHSRSP